MVGRSRRALVASVAVVTALAAARSVRLSGTQSAATTPRVEISFSRGAHAEPGEFLSVVLDDLDPNDVV